MEKVTFFDVEYANSKNKSICQIGISCIDVKSVDPYYPEQDLYINPEDGFDDCCIKIHGITNDKVKNEPNFFERWSELEKYFTNTVIIGHNVAAADIDSLVKCLRRYNLGVPELYYIDTLELAKAFVPSFAVRDYGLHTLCDYFEIDMGEAHDAFDDACACEDLYNTLINEYSINPDECVHRYNMHETEKFMKFVSDPSLRKIISEFYGVIRGFSIDNVITEGETQAVKEWREKFSEYDYREEIHSINQTIDNILADGIITVDEITDLQGVVKRYLDLVNTAPSTLATQILNGILEGIVDDGEVSEAECKKLREWLYDNIYLAGHYPFDKIVKQVEDILEDGVVTKEESERLTKSIHELLHPVETLSESVNEIDDKHICLSGNFEYGSKKEVEEYLMSKGAIVESSVKKSTDFLVVGNCECQAYSQGSYGTKVIKAMEYNEKGCKIQIIKEKDLIG